MFNDLPGLTLLLVLVAIAPGLMSWWRGRILVRLADDAALPERLMKDRQQNGVTLMCAFLALAVLSTDAMPWSIPLLVYGSIIASYPLRKTLFDETWSLRVYVWFVTRLLFGIWGFWIALALTPLLVASAGRFAWPVAGALAIVLAIWDVRYADVLRFVMRVRPIEDRTLLSRFHGLIRTSGIAMPRFERIDLQGGGVANALALPSLGTSSVLFTETLLERLEPDETVAICAHEIAHLEYFSPARLRRMRQGDLGLIAFGAAVMPVANLAGVSVYMLPVLLWAFTLLGAMVWRARDRQRNETASDLRAVELCGDPEALVRGLTRLYTMGRVPRRLDAQYEQRATHPSLARRIRDIRAAAGTASASLGASASFAGTDGRAVVTFEADRLQLSEGEAAVHSLSYGYLSELRLDVHGARPASLIAVERGGRRWEVPLAAADVARAQAVLDVVDARLPPPAAPPAVWPKINRMVLAMIAVVGLTVGQLAMAFVTFLAAFQPSTPLVAAAGFASLASAGVLLRFGGIYSGILMELTIMLSVCGLLLLYMARSSRAEPIPRRAALAAALLGACAALSVATLALGGLDPVRLHQSARSATGAPVLLIAFAGALILWRSRTARYAAIPVVMLAAATSVAASGTFLDRFGRDPFLVPAESFAWKTVAGDVVREFSVPFIASGLQLSPGGRRVALIAGERSEDGPVTFHVGRAGGALHSVAAADLIFADDDRAVLMQPDGDGIELREVALEEEEKEANASREASRWRVQVPDITGAELSLPAGSSGIRRWRVTGWNRNRQAIRAEGVVGEQAVQRTEWPVTDRENRWIKSMAASGDDAIFVETRYDMGYLYGQGLWRAIWLLQPDSETRFRSSGGGTSTELGMSRLDAQCFAAALANDELLCSAFDGTRTRFISIDPASKRFAGLAWMQGRFYARELSTGAWLAGWRDDRPVALNLRRRQAVEISSQGSDRPFQVAASDQVVATIGYNGAGTTVKLYKQ